MAIQFADKKVLKQFIEDVDEVYGQKVEERITREEEAEAKANKRPKKKKEEPDKTSYNMHHPDDIIKLQNKTIIYYWGWLNEWDDDYSTIYDLITSDKYDAALVRVGEASDDGEERYCGDTDGADIYLERSVHLPIDWANFAFNTLPENRQIAHMLAKDWQFWQSGESISYEELARFQDYFQLIGDFFDLTDEFKENGIL